MCKQFVERVVRSFVYAVLLLAAFPQILDGGGRKETVHGRRARREIVWPNPEFPSLQRALDAVPDGGQLTILPGVFELTTPLAAHNKRITIRGAGAGREGDRALTHLYGPEPQPVVDENHRVVLPAEHVAGLLNFVDCNATVRDLRLTGFDAGIVFRDSDRRAADDGVRAKVLKVHISDTGRGILSQSDGDVSVESAVIENTLWNGISAGPAPGGLGVAIPLFSAQGISIVAPGSAGIYFEYTNAAIAATIINGADFCGIVGLSSNAFISDTLLLSNEYAGILLWDCNASILSNFIVDTQSDPNGFAGDAITLVLSSALLLDNQIDQSARASVAAFGSAASLAGNTMTCSAFDINGEPFQGQPPDLIDLAGNQCDENCDSNLGGCLSVSAHLAPPELDTSL